MLIIDYNRSLIKNVKQTDYRLYQCLVDYIYYTKKNLCDSREAKDFNERPFVAFSSKDGNGGG